MNKRSIKIAGWALGLSLTLGAGASVGLINKEPTAVSAGTNEYTFSLTSNPGGWPTTNSSTLTDYTYTLNKVTYTFSLKNVKCNSGYLMCTSTAVLGLPAISGGKLTKVVAYNSNGCSTATEVGISSSSSSANYISGGASQTWSTTGSSYTYNLSGTADNTKYYLYITNKNAQITQLKLSYEDTAISLTDIALSGTGVEGSKPNYTKEIGSSNANAQTISVALTPNNATDQKVNIAHYSGTNNLFTISANQITCTNGAGQFTVTGTGATSGSETFKISGNTQTSVAVYLTVTARDDSKVYRTASFNSNGGSESPANIVVEDGETFVFPSAGTKDHYSFDGWSSNGGSTLYAVGATSPAINADTAFTAYWTEDPKYDVTYVSGEHGTGSNYVVQNQYSGSYQLASFNATGFVADDGYAFKAWKVGNTEYAAGASITLAGATTVTAIYEKAPDVLNHAFAGVESTTYTEWSGKNGSFSSAVYAGKTAGGDNSSGECVQLRSNNSDCGIVTTSSGGHAVKVSVIWNSATSNERTLNVYGKNTAYGVASDLYNANTQGTLLGNIVCGTSTELEIDGSYKYIGIRSSSGAIYLDQINIYWETPNQLDDVTVTITDQQRTFVAGSTFAFNGTLTASYTKADDAVVSPTSFHIGSESGPTIAPGTPLTRGTHNGAVIYVVYTEDDITRSDSFTLIVNYKAVTSVSIGTHAAEIALRATFDHKNVTVTVDDEYADQGYEWIVSSNTVGDDYTFDSNGLTAGDTTGTVTLTCRSTADNSKSDSLVVTITGEPMLTLYDENNDDVSGTVMNCFTTDDELTFYVTPVNFQGTVSYTWSVDGSSVEIDEDAGTFCAFNVVSAGDSRISCNAVGSISGNVTVHVDIHVTVPRVVSLTWNAEPIDEFSGTELTSSIVNGWNVTATREVGDPEVVPFANYTLYLGEDEIDSLPYAWSAEDDGKTLHVEFEGVESSTVSVRITQRINDVVASYSSSWSHTIESKTWDAAGTQKLNGVSWTMSGTGGPYFGYDGTKGQQFGSGGNPYSQLVLATSDFTDTVDSIDVYTSGANSIVATVQVTVGGTAYGGATTISATNTKYTFNLGGKSGEIRIVWNQTSSKAIYVKQIVVNTSFGPGNIANVATHKNAQRVAVKFAKAFNTAMATTNSCTENMSSAWSDASSAFNTFKSEAAALGKTEEAYAKNLIKYATAPAEWPQEFTDAACIEKMVKVYEKCVKDHGQTGFMAELRPVEVPNQARTSQAFNSSSNSSTIGLIALVSTFGVATIAGLAFMRRRKED